MKGAHQCTNLFEFIFCSECEQKRRTFQSILVQARSNKQRVRWICAACKPTASYTKSSVLRTMPDA